MIDTCLPPRTNALLAMLFIAALGSGGAHAEDPAALQADDKQWVMPAKNFANTRFSGLSQITAANAGKLQVA